MRTVVIPCAGTGSRLGELTKNYNKAMCTLGPKPVISYIIEHFTEDDEIIVLLGYKGDYLKQVIQACYPDWNIIFREVDKFEGPGSGLGYSLSRAEDLLQKPFIFWPNDTIVDNDFGGLPYTCNWVMTGKKEADSKDYRHVLINFMNGGCSILPKQSIGWYDSYPYIGISHIYDYDKFWEAYHNNTEQFINEGEVIGINNLPDVMDIPSSGWVDTGNRKIFEQAQREYSAKMEEVILEKPDEAIWFIDNRVVKFHINPQFISDRVERFNTFLSEKQKHNGIKIPKLLYYSDNVYVYEKEPGWIASKNSDILKFRKMLDSFFSGAEFKTLSEKEALEIYEDFYHDKTISRIHKFCKEHDREDFDCHINGIFCLPAEELVNRINWKKIASHGQFTENYHGDFHLENILVQDDEFVMLDWRQNFGKSKIGDIYYDLAKMWHSLIVNHRIVKDGYFNVNDENRRDIAIDIFRTFIDTEMENALKEYIKKNNDIVQAELLTAVVFLNIAACHVGTYSVFLFYLGKYMINRIKIQHPDYFTEAE